MRELIFGLLLFGVFVTRIHGQPVFSSRADGVRVDVLVTDSSGRTPLGLTAADFHIRDNGVPQRIDVVSFGDIALNVVMALDLSESVSGERLDNLRAASESLMAALQPSDQSSLVTFDRKVSLHCPLSVDRSCLHGALPNSAPSGGETALIDGLFAGMLIAESDVGRSLLMVFSDGIDTESWLTTDRVLGLARRSDVVVYGIASKGSRPDFLKDLTSLTGGGLLEVDRKTDLSVTFRSILDEFRHRYLIVYRPVGVPREGWHTLDVRVNRRGVSVRARAGYQG